VEDRMSEHDRGAASDSNEVVLLSGQDGSTYALRRSQLEAFRLTDEERDAMFESTDADVSGFGFGYSTTSSSLSFGGSFKLVRHYPLPSDRFLPPDTFGGVALPGDMF
jgi:hypothetical protein